MIFLNTYKFFSEVVTLVKTQLNCFGLSMTVKFKCLFQISYFLRQNVQWLCVPSQRQKFFKVCGYSVRFRRIRVDTRRNRNNMTAEQTNPDIVDET